MSWSAESFAGPAKEYNFVVAAPSPRPDSGREGALLDKAEQTVAAVVQAFGDQHVSVTCYGHFNSDDNNAGDVLNLSLTGIEPLVGEAADQHQAAIASTTTVEQIDPAGDADATR